MDLAAFLLKGRQMDPKIIAGLNKAIALHASIQAKWRVVCSDRERREEKFRSDVTTLTANVASSAHYCKEYSALLSANSAQHWDYVWLRLIMGFQADWASACKLYWTAAAIQWHIWHFPSTAYNWLKVIVLGMLAVVQGKAQQMLQASMEAAMVKAVQTREPTPPCVICMDAPRSIGFQHVDGSVHYAVCRNCAKAAPWLGHPCPMCRQKVVGLPRVVLA